MFPDLRPESVGAALADVGVGPVGGRGGPPAVTRLDGGYSWITLAVRWGDGEAVIVRVAPRGGTVEPYDPAAEARRLRAVAGVVPAPEVLAVGALPNPIGRPFGVHSFVPGEVVRRPADPAPYRKALAQALGHLHSQADPRALADPPADTPSTEATPRSTGGRRSPGGCAPVDVSSIDAAGRSAGGRGGSGSRAPVDALGDFSSVEVAYRVELARQADAYRRCWRHPGIDVALRWLAAHVPAAGDRPVLCHGDFRPANVLWTAPGVIGGIIDWERAWVGDPLCDLAFSMHLGGWGAIEGEALEAYWAAGGARVGSPRSGGARISGSGERSGGARAAGGTRSGGDDRLRYALRFERVRSILSGMQGLAALVAGRADDPRLTDIGAAAQAGAWALVDWLEPGLPPLADLLDPPEAPYPRHTPADERHHAPDHGPESGPDPYPGKGDDRHDSAPTGDKRDSGPAHGEDGPGQVDRPVGLGGRCGDHDFATERLGSPADGAWPARWRELTEQAATGGPELIEPLRRLARRDTSRPGLPQVRWRDA